MSVMNIHPTMIKNIKELELACQKNQPYCQELVKNPQKRADLEKFLLCKLPTNEGRAQFRTSQKFVLYLISNICPLIGPSEYQTILKIIKICYEILTPSHKEARGRLKLFEGLADERMLVALKGNPSVPIYLVNLETDSSGSIKSRNILHRSVKSNNLKQAKALHEQVTALFYILLKDRDNLKNFNPLTLALYLGRFDFFKFVKEKDPLYYVIMQDKNIFRQNVLFAAYKEGKLATFKFLHENEPIYFELMLFEPDKNGYLFLSYSNDLTEDQISILRFLNQNRPTALKKLLLHKIQNQNVFFYHIISHVNKFLRVFDFIDFSRYRSPLLKIVNERKQNLLHKSMDYYTRETIQVFKFFREKDLDTYTKLLLQKDKWGCNVLFYTVTHPDIFSFILENDRYLFLQAAGDIDFESKNILHKAAVWGRQCYYSTLKAIWQADTQLCGSLLLQKCNTGKTPEQIAKEWDY